MATGVAAELARRGVEHEVLDGDTLRAHFSAGLGFSKEGRSAHLKRVAYLCHLLTKHGVVVAAAFVSPYRDLRREIRRQIEDGQGHHGRFVEVYVKCAVEICMQRDAKGLYRQALAGQIPQFTGVSDPYEEPLEAEVVLRTGVEPVQACLDTCLAYLEQHHIIPRQNAA